MVTHIISCRFCRSPDVIRHGLDRKGDQRYRCHACRKTFRQAPGSAAHPVEFRARVLAAYEERCSMRGVCRVFGISRQTLVTWLKKVRSLPALRDTLLPPAPGDCLELDELWSFVRLRANKQWVWLALCRRTRQVVAYAVGCRGERTCRRLWDRVPPVYRRGVCFTDFWEAYAKVVPPDQHAPCGKEAGQTNHIERFNNTLRQRLARFVRKTLSFSKKRQRHKVCLALFLHSYNRQCAIRYNNRN